MCCDPAAKLFVAQFAHGVGCTADLECAALLKILTLETDITAGNPVDGRRCQYGGPVDERRYGAVLTLLVCIVLVAGYQFYVAWFDPISTRLDNRQVVVTADSAVLQLSALPSISETARKSKPQIAGGGRARDRRAPPWWGSLFSWSFLYRP